MRFKIVIILTLIIALAALLRFWNLGSVPISPDWDEVSLGYNAYSLLQTGHDEYNTFLPVVLKSFGDYKPALYMYTIIPFIFIFNLSTLAVRFPSALLGTLTVLALYCLVKELFSEDDMHKNKNSNPGNFYTFSIIQSDAIALASAFFLAISPWHIQFSRVGFESNLGLACNVFAALFFVKGFKKPIFLCFSSACAALSLYAYQSEKVFTPLLMLTLILLYWRMFLKIPRKYIIEFISVGIIVVLPLLLFTIATPQSLSRAKSTSIFSGTNTALHRSEVRMIQNHQKNDIAGLLLDNKEVVFAKEIVAGYLSHFDPNWLFVTGDIERHHAPAMGLLYLFELPLILSGIFALIFYYKSPAGLYSKWVPFAFLFLAPVPAAITQDVPHAVRALNMVPFFAIASGFGFVFLLSWVRMHIKKNYLQFVIYCIFSFIFLFNFLYYLNQYFVQTNYFYAKNWQYGYAQIMDTLARVKENYPRIVVSSEAPFDQSYIFFLFYLKYPPEKYQKIRSNYTGDIKMFDNFVFRPIRWSLDHNLVNTLFVGDPREFSNDAEIIDTLRYPDQTPAIEFVAGAKK